jgi:hypothetical protein
MADHSRTVLARRASPAHHDFRTLLAAVIERRQQEYRAQGRDATADAIARIAASTGMARLVNELERGRPAYMRATTAALFWRDLPLRRRLKKLPQYGQALQAFRWAAWNEAAARAACAAEMVRWLAEVVTQPDEQTRCEIAMHQHEFEEARRAWQLLCANGLADQAKVHLTQSVKHLVIANNIARDWTPDRNKLLRSTGIRLERLFGFRGDRIAARLVAAALGAHVSRRQSFYAVKIIRR